MIIWLASYPKSGNTWLRAFISSLIFDSNNENALENLKKIRGYPLTSDFYDLLDSFDDFKKIAENWKISQEFMNLQKGTKIIKTHHAFCQIDNHNFTNYINSLGVIYIVRDPRNIITSFINHYSSVNNYNDALKFILDKNRFLGKFGKKENFKNIIEFPAFISSWGGHYKSWKYFKKNYLLIKYEELIDEPEKIFLKIAKYLGELLEINIDKEKVDNAILKSSFSNLQQNEKKFGFSEATQKTIVQKKRFFNLGPENNWQKLLPKKIRNEIEKNFKEEMIELGYL